MADPGTGLRVTLTRPAKLNAISGAMERELCEALLTDTVRSAACLVITGGPDVFSAGADVTEMRGLDPAEIVGYYRATGDFAERIADLPSRRSATRATTGRA